MIYDIRKRTKTIFSFWQISFLRLNGVEQKRLCTRIKLMKFVQFFFVFPLFRELSIRKSDDYWSDRKIFLSKNSLSYDEKAFRLQPSVFSLFSDETAFRRKSLSVKLALNWNSNLFEEILFKRAFQLMKLFIEQYSVERDSIQHSLSVRVALNWNSL